MAPVIALNGPASLTLASGDTYVEEGATATDDIDGDVTATVVITGSVNTAVVGTYSVTYTANDRAGNRTSTVRSVQVGVNLQGCHDIVVSSSQFEENQDALHCFDGFNLCMTGSCVDEPP